MKEVEDAREALASFEAAMADPEQDLDVVRQTDAEDLAEHLRRVLAAVESLSAPPTEDEWGWAEDVFADCLSSENVHATESEHAARRSVASDPTARLLCRLADGNWVEVSAPPTEDEVHVEAHRRYDGDTIIDEITGEPTSHDDWGYADCQRQAFIAGAAWRNRHREPITDEMVEAATAALTRLRHTTAGWASPDVARAALEAAESTRTKGETT